MTATKKELTPEQKDARREAQRRFRAKHSEAYDPNDGNGRTLLHSYLLTTTSIAINEFAEKFGLDKWEVIALCVAQVKYEVSKAANSETVKSDPGDGSSTFARTVERWKISGDIGYTTYRDKLAFCTHASDRLFNKQKQELETRKMDTKRGKDITK